MSFEYEDYIIIEQDGSQKHYPNKMAPCLDYGKVYQYKDYLFCDNEEGWTGIEITSTNLNKPVNIPEPCSEMFQIVKMENSFWGITANSPFTDVFLCQFDQEFKNIISLYSIVPDHEKTFASLFSPQKPTHMKYKKVKMNIGDYEHEKAFRYYLEKPLEVIPSELEQCKPIPIPDSGGSKLIIQCREVLRHTYKIIHDKKNNKHYIKYIFVYPGQIKRKMIKGNFRDSLKESDDVDVDDDD